MYRGQTTTYKDEDDLMFPMEDDEVSKKAVVSRSSDCLYCQVDQARGETH